MSNEVKPFDRLSDQDKQVAIDLACACSLIIAYLPSVTEAVFTAITDEFSVERRLPHNTAKYAMRALGRTLFETGWTFSITKEPNGDIVTSFVHHTDRLGANGDQSG